MMRKNKAGEHGVITVLISLLLVGILSVGTLVIEAGRFQAAKTQLNEANASAGTSMLAAYDATLYDRFGLLAIDTETFSLGRYQDYLEFNSDRSAGYKGNNLSTLYLLDGLELEGIYNLTYPAVLKRQILSGAKYRAPQDYALNYYNLDFFLTDLQNMTLFVSDQLADTANGNAETGEVPAEMRGALSALYQSFSDVKKYNETYDVTLNASTLAKLPGTTGTVLHNAPAEDLPLIRDAVSDAQSVLGSNGAILASGEGAGYEEIDVRLDVGFVSNVGEKLSTSESIGANAKSMAADCRNLMQGINAAINMLSNDKESNLLLNTYITEVFPNRNNTVTGYSGPTAGTAGGGAWENMNFTGACVEYAIAGQAGERVNQQMAYDYIMALRLVSNLDAVMRSSELFDTNNAGSVAAHIAWAYYETCVDMELMVQYQGNVPFRKNNLILPITNIPEVEKAFNGDAIVVALDSLGVFNDQMEIQIDGLNHCDYRDSLMLALWFVPNSEKLMRVADLIQMEMRYREQYVEGGSATFLLSEQNTFCRVKCGAKLNSILPVIAAGSNGGVKGTEFLSIKYVGY